MANKSNDRTTVRDDGTVYDRGPSWPSITVFSLAMALTAVLYNNCSNEFVLEGVTDEALLKDLSVCDAQQARVFMSSIHPFARTNCASCHVMSGPPGASTAAFAESTKLTAFNSFLLPGFDKFKAYALNPGHVSGITGSMHQATMDSIEETWYSSLQEAGCATDDMPGEFQAKTVDKPIGPTTATAKVIRWNLDAESDRSSQFGGATFEIRISQVSPGGGSPSYYITGPIIKTAAEGLEVKKLSIFINGVKYIEGTTFLGIDRYVPPANTNTTLSSAVMVKQMPAGILATDTISVAFNHLRIPNAPPPMPTPTPSPTPPPAINGSQLYANTCQACHGTLAASTKRGRTAAQIQTARTTVPAMMDNAGVQALSAEEINAIAAALQ